MKIMLVIDYNLAVITNTSARLLHFFRLISYAFFKRAMVTKNKIIVETNDT